MDYSHFFSDFLLPNPKKVAKSLLDKHWDGVLPIEPAEFAKKEGLTVRASTKLAQSSFSGAIGYEGDTPVIIFNPFDHPNRQRFTIAHELGHFACGHLGDSKEILFRDTSANLLGKVKDPKEIDANKFAAEVLMPEEAVRYLINKVVLKTETLDSLAGKFSVSPRAMEIRLINLGIIEEYD